ncbi:hypothetical protein RI534_09530 [Aeromonas allosaccharophila]|uniref:hypothetical protein n=1 Tax=Aeromonas allosaccharophila TaxID=656 RepID=UPI00341E2C8E
MQLTLLNDSGKFDGLDDTIRHVFAETANKLNALFDLSQLDVTFSPFTKGDDNGPRIRGSRSAAQLKHSFFSVSCRNRSPLFQMKKGVFYQVQSAI